MSPQHDYVIDNSTGSNVRSDINSVLQAIASNNSGSSAPSTTVASQFFADTNAGIMKLRNTSNNGFVNLFTLAGGVDVDGDSNFRADVTFSGATTGRDVVFDTSDNALRFADNAKAKFGTGDDLHVFFDGSNSIIREPSSVAGQLLIDGFNGTDIRQGSTGDLIVRAVGSGSVELYHDNSKKLETISGGISVTGGINTSLASTFATSAFTGDISLGDDVKAKFGTDNDFIIKHDGSSASIDNDTGQLIIESTSDTTMNIQSVFRVNTKGGSENAITAITDGAVELYHDNSKKFETQSGGCKITGSLTCTGSYFPAVDNTINLGNASFRFNTVFATNGSINTSDRNEKNTIVECDLGLSFINKLKPVSYKWNKDDGKTHYGLIAQDIEETILSLGKTISDFGAISKEKDSPMGLSYPQLLSPLIKAVQELSAKVAALEAS